MNKSFPFSLVQIYLQWFIWSTKQTRKICMIHTKMYCKRNFKWLSMQLCQCPIHNYILSPYTLCLNKYVLDMFIILKTDYFQSWMLYISTAENIIDQIKVARVRDGNRALPSLNACRSFWGGKTEQYTGRMNPL